MPDDSLAARLNLLDQYVRDLRDTQPPNFAAYESDKTPALQRTQCGASVLRRYTERMLHMAVDACVQIGIDLLTQEGLRSPANYHDVFIVLGERGILPQDTVDCMTALVEFRNLLVYEHSTVDDMMVYGFAKKRLDDFVDFARVIRRYLSRARVDSARIERAV